MTGASIAKAEQLPDSMVVAVRASSGAYITATVFGRRASCTMSAHEAAARVAEKLYGAGATAVLHSHDGPGQSRWVIARGVA